MASILAFPAGSAARRSVTQQSGLRAVSGEILLFTGVYYQRMDDMAAPVPEDRRSIRRKADEKKSG